MRRRSLVEKIGDAWYALVCAIFTLIGLCCAVIFVAVAWEIVRTTRW